MVATGDLTEFRRVPSRGDVRCRGGHLGPHGLCTLRVCCANSRDVCNDVAVIHTSCQCSSPTVHRRRVRYAAAIITAVHWPNRASTDSRATRLRPVGPEAFTQPKWIQLIRPLCGLCATVRVWTNRVFKVVQRLG
jgi:hypothetical protein